MISHNNIIADEVSSQTRDIRLKLDLLVDDLNFLLDLTTKDEKNISLKSETRDSVNSIIKLVERVGGEK